MNETPSKRIINTPQRIKELLMTMRIINRHGCWLWTMALDEDGYGRVSIKNRMHLVSRVAGWLFNGWDLYDDRMVCHRCDVFYSREDRTYRRCFNPEHTFQGSAKDNSQDSVEKDRWVSGSRNGFALLDEEKVKEIKILLCRPHITYEEIGRRYGVAPSTIGRIARGEKWIRVPWPHGRPKRKR